MFIERSWKWSNFSFRQFSSRRG